MAAEAPDSSQDTSSREGCSTVPESPLRRSAVRDTLTRLDEWLLLADVDSWSVDDLRFAMIVLGERLTQFE